VWLIVGLGNPGPAYLHTRHNVGFSVVRQLLTQMGGLRLRPALGGVVGSGQLGGAPVTICQPMTYMNRSGGPVGDLAEALGIPAHQVLVIHDDLDLPFGTIRCKKRGGHGGHNGLRDIARRIGRDHPRVRFGIGRPGEGEAVSDHVLGPWSDKEQLRINDHLSRAAAAVEATVTLGLDAAMNQFNVRVPLAAEHPPRKTPRASDEVREKT